MALGTRTNLLVPLRRKTKNTTSNFQDWRWKEREAKTSYSITF